MKSLIPYLKFLMVKYLKTALIYQIQTKYERILLEVQKKFYTKLAFFKINMAVFGKSNI